MSIKVTITEQGLTSLINAQNNGSAALKLTQAKLGKGRYTPDAQQVDLVEPFKTLSTIAGKVVEDHLIHLTIKDESADEYEVGEFGIYTDTGVLFAVYSDPDQDDWILEKDALATLLLAIDISLQSVTTDCIEFGNIELISPPASYDNRGVVQLADRLSVLAPKHDQVPTVDAVHQLIKHLFVGQVSAFACAHAPAGWLVADGASLQRSDYPELWTFAQSSGNLALAETDKALGQFGPGNGTTSFSLPDLRGEFIRALSPERGMGSSEADSIKSHTHSGATADAGEHKHPITIDKQGLHSHSGTTADAGHHAHTGVTNGAGYHNHSGHTSYDGLHNHNLSAMGKDGINGNSNVYGWEEKLRDVPSYHISHNTTLAGNHRHVLSISGSGNHQHSLAINTNGNHRHAVDTLASGEHQHNASILEAGQHHHSLIIDHTGGHETRPRNIALLMCIKY
jgi:microcystin-dependent protein